MIVLKKIGAHEALVRRLSRWLLTEATDDFSAMRALHLADPSRPATATPDPFRATINGHQVVASGPFPAEWLQKGPNEITVERGSKSEAFAVADIRYFAVSPVEKFNGLRVLRKFEILNEAGQWTEIKGSIPASTAVRCTVVEWGDEFPDAIRLTNPIPTGFEFVDSDDVGNARQEVRDGAVIEYLVNFGLPQVFRYYLRAESLGKVVALPAVAESLRRPEVRGQTDEALFVVKAP